jgi:pimeloyl-ACP methyl ester carboxylesterase
MAATTSGGRCHVESYGLARVDAGRFKVDVLALIHGGPASSNMKLPPRLPGAAALYQRQNNAVCASLQKALTARLDG